MRGRASQSNDVREFRESILDSGSFQTSSQRARTRVSPSCKIAGYYPGQRRANLLAEAAIGYFNMDLAN